jgi:3'(2'), 5'-bisphosphate nucleotidase
MARHKRARAGARRGVNPRDLLSPVIDAARRAGAAINGIYASDFAIIHKEDLSPVTEADHRAEAIIAEALARLTPGVAIVAEEHCDRHGVPKTAPPVFWLVDPLDGTKEFVRRNGEFSVNIALVEGTRPVLGVIHAPVSGVTYWTAGAGAFRDDREIRCRRPPAAGLTVVHSRSLANSPRLAEYLAPLGVAERRVCGSALKFCLIAAGEADLYPRFGTTMEWDTAAGQAILEAAGGSVTTPEGEVFTYAKEGFRNTSFIARGRP